MMKDGASRHAPRHGNPQHVDVHEEDRIHERKQLLEVGSLDGGRRLTTDAAAGIAYCLAVCGKQRAYLLQIMPAATVDLYRTRGGARLASKWVGEQVAKQAGEAHRAAVKR